MIYKRGLNRESSLLLSDVRASIYGIALWLFFAAETVRVIGEDKRPKSITSLKKCDCILGWCQKGARHIGAEISSNVSER